MLLENPSEALAENSQLGEHKETWHQADIICGGFPCQDISHAGDGAGITAERSGLWAYLCGSICLVRPLFAIVENVAALLGKGMDTVYGDLALIGYDAEWHCIRASDVGAEHERNRIWIVAYPDGERELQSKGGEQKQRGRAFDGSEKTSANTLRAGLSRRCNAATDSEDARNIAPRLRLTIAPPSELPRDYWQYQPLLGRGIHGVPNRMDRIKSLGNSVYPEIPEIIGHAILKYESEAVSA